MGTTGDVAPGVQSLGAPSGRLWEIDAARTLAILVTVAYHGVYDVELLRVSVPTPSSAAGDSFRRPRAGSSSNLAGAALVVTAATSLALGDRYVRFGILHAIALGTVVAAATVRLGAWNIVPGVAAIAAGVALSGLGRTPGYGRPSPWVRQA